MWNGIRIVQAVAIAAVTASAASAQNVLFTWSGRVDEEVQLVINGRSLTTTNIGPREGGQRASDVAMGLPHENGEITIDVVAGRGNVEVMRQPTAANGYTAMIKIADPQVGAGDYKIRALWEPSANGEVGPPMGRMDYDRGGEARPEDRTALAWQGEVDGNLEIRLGPDGSNYRTLNGKDPKDVQSTTRGLPTGATHVRVEQLSGRGQVYVVQQPTEANGYVARLRITDPASGYGHYSFNVFWR